MDFILRDYQQSVVDATLNWIKYRDGNGYVTSPGASGKSLMIAKVAEACAEMNKRVFILARNEKLLRQNREKISSIYPVGMYCSGLEQWDAEQIITVASIQSIVNAKDIRPPDIILTDEAHEINPDSDSETQYWDFFRACGLPQIIGFTATPFRTKSGRIQWGEEIINIPLAPLIEQGYIIPPVNKVTNTPDLSQVNIIMGEYHQKQLEEIYENLALLDASIKKIWQYSQGRNSVLIFVQSIKHGEMLKLAMYDNGMAAVMVDGDIPKIDELATILEDFEAKKFKYLINCNLLTTGYDAPNIDMVAIIRSTISKGFFEQMVYRGCRLYPEKKDFILLDMGGNLDEHGPLGSPYRKASTKERKKSQGRICPACETFCTPTDTECKDCGFQFPKTESRKVSHDGYEDNESNTVYSGAIETYDVMDVVYREHKSKAGNRTLRVDYLCRTKYGSISEWYSPYAENDWARTKLSNLFKERGAALNSDVKEYSMEDLILHAQKMKRPCSITVDHSEKFPRIKRVEYEQIGRIGYTAGTDLLADDCIPF